VPVDLPKTSAQQVGGKDEPLVVSVNSKDEVFLGDTKYELKDLADKLKAVHEEKPDQRVFIRGDKSINYGRMMEVMGVVIDAGFRQMGLLGEQAGGAPAGNAPATAAPVGRPAPAPAPRR
jgi:biopolymer transport protein TolR